MGATSLASFAAEIDVDGSKGDAALDSLTGKIKGVGGWLGSATSALAGFVGGSIIVGGAEKAFDLLGGAVKDYTAQAGEAQQLQAQIDNTLANEGKHAATTSQAISDLADHYSTLTTYSAETIKAGEGVLARFQSIGKDVFPLASQAALDLAAKLGKPPSDAALLLGKSLDNLPGSFAKLEKQGITPFTDAQKAAIIAMDKAGDHAGAQKLFLHDLEGAYGGAAQAAGNTFAGQQEILTNELEKTKVSIGSALIPVLGALLTAFLPLIHMAGDLLPVALHAFSGFVTSSVMPAIQQFSQWMQADGIPLIKTLAEQFVTNIVPAVKQFAGFIMSDVLPAVIALGTWIFQNVVPILITLAQVIMDDVVPTVEAIVKTIVAEFLPPLQQLWELLGPKITPVLQFIGAVIKDVVGPVIEYLIGVLGRTLGVVVGVIGALGGLLGAIGWVKDVTFGLIGIFVSLNAMLLGPVIGAFKAVGSLVGSVFGALWGVVKAPLNSMIDGINVIIGGLDSIHFDIPDWVPGVGGRGFGINIGRIPHLAGGGDMVGGGLVSVGDQDKELAILPASAKVIGRSATEQLANFGGGSGQGHTHDIYIDGRKVATAIAPHSVAVQRAATGIRA